VFAELRGEQRLAGGVKRFADRRSTAASDSLEAKAN
jgi:hypothetical protein